MVREIRNFIVLSLNRIVVIARIREIGRHVVIILTLGNAAVLNGHADLIIVGRLIRSGRMKAALSSGMKFILRHRR